MDNQLRLAMIIGGEKVNSVSGETMQVRNPARHDEIVGTVPRGTKEDVRRAVDAAEEAFHNTWWSDRFESRRRGRILWKASEVVRERAENLARVLTMEQGKPLKESVAEVNSFANTLEYYAGWGGKIADNVYHVKDGDVKLEVTDMKRPVGVCGAIIPWNFPVSLMGWKLGAGLISGNTFIVKPSSTTPLTDILIIDILHEAGIPKGVVNVVTGPSSEVGREIVENPKIRRVAFTGSTETGKRILLDSANQIKHITLELGGSDPTIVCDDANLREAAEAIVFSGRFRNCGQSCTSVKRLYVFDSVFDEFIKLLKENVMRLKLGNGLDPNVNMGPLHTDEQRRSVERLVNEAVEAGAKVITGGKRPDGKGFEKGYFYEPTLLIDVKDGLSILREECFGPALPIIKVSGIDEAIDKANDSLYGLGACIWTKSSTYKRKFVDKIESGIKWINYKPLSVPETSFGGIKESGVGRELGIKGLEEYLEIISVRERVE